MKNLFSTLLTTLAFTPLFSQTDLIVTLCGNTEKVITQAKLLECPELLVNNTNWKVKSYMFTLIIGEKADTIFEIKNNGYIISEQMLMLIKKHHPEKIYIEKIQLIDEAKKLEAAKPLVITLDN